MSALSEKDITERGAGVAEELGWPEDQTGLRGAAAGLLDLGSDFRRPVSSQRLVMRYRARSAEAVRRRVIESIRGVYR